jgi:hypothetical protein
MAGGAAIAANNCATFHRLMAIFEWTQSAWRHSIAVARINRDEPRTRRI